MKKIKYLEGLRGVAALIVLFRIVRWRMIGETPPTVYYHPWYSWRRHWW